MFFYAHIRGVPRKMYIYNSYINIIPNYVLINKIVPSVRIVTKAEISV